MLCFVGILFGLLFGCKFMWSNILCGMLVVELFFIVMNCLNCVIDVIYGVILFNVFLVCN